MIAFAALPARDPDQPRSPANSSRMSMINFARLSGYRRLNVKWSESLANNLCLRIVSNLIELGKSDRQWESTVLNVLSSQPFTFGRGFCSGEGFIARERPFAVRNIARSFHADQFQIISTALALLGVKEWSIRLRKVVRKHLYSGSYRQGLVLPTMQVSQALDVHWVFRGHFAS